MSAPKKKAYERNKRGTVAVEEKQGKLRIRLPRTVAIASARYISTRLDITPENYKKAQVKAWEIEDDIRLGRLDITLEKYKVPKTHPLIFPGWKKTLPTPLSLIELWAKYCKFRQSQVAVTTFEQEYLTKFYNIIERLPSQKIEDAVAIRDYLVTTRTSNAAKRVLTQLNACCNWGVKSKLIASNPFTGMAQEIKIPPRTGDDIDPFSLSERDAIIEAYQQCTRYSHYYNFIRFLFFTGCRPGEACALRWEHITQDCTSILFCETYNSRYHLHKDTKTHRSRRFPCNTVLKELLLNIRTNTCKQKSLVFTTITGKQISNERVENTGWRHLIDRLVLQGLVERYRPPYNTRHTFITGALDAGLTVPQVAQLVGNSPEVILRHYAGNTLASVPVF